MFSLNRFLSFARRHKILIRGGIAGGPAFIVLLWSFSCFAYFDGNIDFYRGSFFSNVSRYSTYTTSFEQQRIPLTGFVEGLKSGWVYSASVTPTLTINSSSGIGNVLVDQIVIYNSDGSQSFSLPLGTTSTIRFIYHGGSSPLSVSFDGYLSYVNNSTGSASVGADFTLSVSISNIVQQMISPDSFQSEIAASTDRIAQQQQDYHAMDQQQANQAGSDMAGFSKQLEGLKEGWGILWYPITFTQRLLTVFTGGSNSAVYTVAYDGVTGYSYDEDSGYLVPIRSPVATIADLPSAGAHGPMITFPSYTLPVLNVKLWDAYTFDLSSVKEQFPALFNAIYVVITVLEVFWFVSFLRSKYEEVFG